MKPGDKVAQLLVIPYAECMLVESKLNKTKREERGFGSTGIDGLEQFDYKESSKDICGNETSVEDQLKQNDELINLEDIYGTEIDSEQMKWIESVFQ